MNLMQIVKETLSSGTKATVPGEENGFSENGEIHYQDKFSLLLNSIPSIVTYVDKNHYLQYVNGAFEKILNRERRSVIGRPLADFWGEEAYQAIRGHVQTALSGKKVHYEMEVQLKDGARYIEATYIPDFDENGIVRGYVGLINDLTEKKHTERELKKKQLELQDYVDNANAGLHWVDGDGIILWANKAELSMLGYSPEEFVGRPISEFHVSKAKIDDILNRLLSNENVIQQEAEMRHKDGSVRTVLISSNGLWDEGKFVHTRCITTDITDRKQLGEKLHEREAHYRGLLENLPVAVYTCDVKGRITLFNKAAASLWGREPEVGKDMWCGSWKIYQPDGITPMELDTCPMAIALKEGRPVNGEEIIIERPDGKRHHVQPYPAPMFDREGKIAGAANMLLDVTDRKRVEKELAYFASLVHSSTDAIISKTLKGIITSWNEAAERMFGYTAAEMIGQPVLRLIPTDRLGEEPMILERLKRGEMVEHFETRRITKDKKLLDISLTISPVRDKEGRIIGASKIARDITAQRAINRKLIESEERFRMASESTQLGTWEFHPFTGKLIWSDECKKIYGVPVEFDPTNEFVAEHMHPEDAAFVHEQVTKAMDPDNQESFHMEYRIFGEPDKQLRWIRVRGKVYFDSQQQPERFVGTMLDITDQKQSQKALEESEQRSRLAIEASQMGTFNWDLVTQEFISSPRLRDIFGFSNQSNFTHQDLIDSFHPEDRAARDKAVSEAPEKGSLNYEVRIIWPDKSIHWVKVFGKIIYYEKKQPLRMYGTVIDTTEEKTAENALRESKARLDIAIDAAGLGMWELKVDSGQLIYSQRNLEILGFESGAHPNQEELMSKIHPDDLQMRNKVLKTALQTGAMDLEMRIRPTENSLRWIRAKGKVFYDENRVPEKILGTTMDVTETKAVLDVLQENEERFRTIANTAPVMIWMSGNDRLPDFFNTSWLNFTGRTMEQESNEGWLQGVHPDDVQKRVDTYFRRSLNKDSALYTEYRLKRRDGRYRWIADNSVPRINADGSFGGFISACTDIDDQKNFREKIMESELLLKTISNASPVGLWMTDPQAQCTFVNDTWIEWTGIPFEKQMGTGWLDRVLEEDKIAAPSKFWECLQKREKYTTEFRILRADDQIRWCLTEGSPYYDIDGEFAGYAGSVTDITDMKKMEERKDDFIKMASHELRTPITSINGYVQLLSKIYEEHSADRFLASKPTVKGSLSTISKQVSKLTRLISEMLDLSRIESGKLELSKTEFDIVELVEETLQDIRLTTPHHSIHLSNDFEGSIYADRDRISQVLVNLLTNAIKYSPGADRVEVEVGGNANEVIIKVKDYGIGIDGKDQEMIFQRFYRVEGKSEQTYPGFGIGLFIVNEIVHRHNGVVAVESKKNKGSVFSVTLPVGRK